MQRCGKSAPGPGVTRAARQTPPGARSDRGRAARPQTPPGRPLEPASNRRPRWMVATGAFGHRYRIRRTGRLTTAHTLTSKNRSQAATLCARHTLATRAPAWCASPLPTWRCSSELCACRARSMSPGLGLRSSGRSIGFLIRSRGAGQSIAGRLTSDFASRRCWSYRIVARPRVRTGRLGAARHVAQCRGRIPQPQQRGRLCPRLGYDRRPGSRQRGHVTVIEKVFFATSFGFDLSLS